MTDVGHLWAVGYDDVRRAEQMRDEVARLSERHCLVLRDTAVAVRYADGSFTLDGEPYVLAGNIGGPGLASFLARLALAPPPFTPPAVDCCRSWFVVEKYWLHGHRRGGDQRGIRRRRERNGEARHLGSIRTG